MPGLTNQPRSPAMERFFSSRDTSWADKAGGVVPFYPKKIYIEKNLAPELDISRQQLEALAEANLVAKKSGLMPQKILDKMLPTLLTESATGISAWGYPDTPKYRNILIKAGLPPTLDEINRIRADQTNYDRDLRKSKLMHAVMAAKVADYGEDLAIERWNGKGKGMGGMADASNHARKVAELEQMLQHPKNKEMMDVWNDYRTKHSGNAPAPTFRPLDEDFSDDPFWLANLKDAVGINGNIADTAGGLVRSAQQGIRNWTAPAMMPSSSDEDIWTKIRGVVDRAFSK